jgi:vancomycin resistance protein YoaR
MSSKKSLKSVFKKKLFIYSLLFLLVLISLLISLLTYFNNRIYPGISVAGQSLGGLTKEEAILKLSQTLSQRSSKTFELNYQSTSDLATASAIPNQYNLSLNAASYNIDLPAAVDQAFSYGHNQFFLPPKDVEPQISLNQDVDSQLSQIAKAIDKEAIDAKLSIQEDQILVTPSQEGYVVDQKAVKDSLINYLKTNQSIPTNLPIKKSSPRLSYETALSLKQRLEEIKLSPLSLTFKDQTFLLDLATILTFIDTQESQPKLLSGELLGEKIDITSLTLGETEITDNTVSLNQSKVSQFLETITPQINQPVQEPLFNYNPSSPNKITEFRPPQQGQTLNIPLTTKRISDSLLSSNQTKVALAVDVVPPQNKLVNDLGIKELIGEGVSNFAHSIPNRAYNVALAAQKVNGVLVPPGSEFSFNQTVGDITAATGFKPAYVIKSGKTVLDDGGGVCQVSTTLFRAALNTGLPITQRTAHAYRVEYYEQGFPPGMDATTFYPSVDLKFRNDTTGHILIQTRIEGTTLYISFYGTSDGRIVNLTKPQILSQTPPLPELRQDDPALPKGTVKQVDFAAAGANVIFYRTVTKNDQVLFKDTFRSNYRPWQAVYLVGTKEN